MKVIITGLDGSKTNFGIAKMQLDTETLALSVIDLILVKTEKSKHKSVRVSSDNLARAQEVAQVLYPACSGSTAVFAEVPSGGQSANAVMGFGIVVGLYAAIQEPLLEVSPSETKKATVGTRTASKEEMIEWATEAYPDAPWRMRRLKGEMVPTADNEHLADAVAICHAGIKLPAFKQVLAMLQAQEKRAA